MLEAYQRLTNNIVNRVNEQRGMNRRVREAVAPPKVRKEFVETAVLAAEHRLTAGHLTEASRRLHGDKFLITQHDAWFAQLSEDDLTVGGLTEAWQMEQDLLPARVDWHRLIYRLTEAQAILLCQPAAATAVAARPRRLDAACLLDAPRHVGAIGCVPPQDAAITEHAAQATTLLVQGVGLLTWGDTLRSCIIRAETVDRWCDIVNRMGNA